MQDALFSDVLVMDKFPAKQDELSNEPILVLIYAQVSFPTPGMGSLPIQFVKEGFVMSDHTQADSSCLYKPIHAGLSSACSVTSSFTEIFQMLARSVNSVLQ
ncbi:hypothetical protein AAFF_G00368870 [Aldrovandia affinis]|uniref:Uncharacterized protein n=1 Tax=Aldrovandia affinis TaxID=143900 RepID=A0AAD7SH46_9TELE|nr:hypothetical protein AAFF_G00368870 [Aldrovandia affinis]